MLTRISHFSGFALVGLLGLLTACKPSTDAVKGSNSTASSESHEHEHDHDHARPASLADGVAQIKTHVKTVEEAFANNKPQECDDALHELAEILEVLPDVAAESDMPKESWEEVKKASAGLFDAMMKIHEGFHGEDAKGASYNDVKTAIDENLAVLEAQASAGSATTGGDASGGAEASGEGAEDQETATESAP